MLQCKWFIQSFISSGQGHNALELRCMKKFVQYLASLDRGILAWTRIVDDYSSRM